MVIPESDSSTEKYFEQSFVTLSIINKLKGIDLDHEIVL